MNTEIWKDIPGFEGRYQVSSLGRVKTLRFRGWAHLGERIMGLTVCKSSGYQVVKLCRRKYQVHQLVAWTFLGEQGGLDVNHLDGNRGNNVLGNLEYCTRRQNILHSRDVLGRPIGGKAHKKKHEPGYVNPLIGRAAAQGLRFSEEQVREIRHKLQAGSTLKSLAREYGCDRHTIQNIARNNTLAYQGIG